MKKHRMDPFLQHLAKQRLVLESKVPHGHAAKIFDRTIRNLMRWLGVEVVIVDTYSASKSCELAHYNGVDYLVFDHALLDFFHLLNTVGSIEMKPDIAMAMLHRSLCEACRDASLLREYAFFAIRSHAINPFVRNLLNTPSAHASTYWQSIVILGHEAAHALPPTHELTKQFDGLVTLRISQESTQIVSRINSKFLIFLDNLESEDPVEETEQLADELNLLKVVDDNNESISMTFMEKSNDPRFKAEIKCDFFSVYCMESYLKEYLEKNEISSFEEFLTEALLNAHRTFLNMRFHEYMKGVASLKGRIGAEEINPLKLDTLVEFIIRGNLFTDEIIRVFEDLSRQVKLESDVEVFRKTVLRSSSDHTNRLFVPLSTLLEETLLNPKFGSIRDKQLAEDGYDSSAFDSEPWSVVKRVDALWETIVG